MTAVRKKQDKIYISYDSTNKNCQAGDIEIVEFGHAKEDRVLPIFNYSIAYDCNNRYMDHLGYDFVIMVKGMKSFVNEWHEYVVEQRDHDLDTIIAEEKLKPEDTRKFMENAFRDGEIKTAGTDIDKLMPPIARFGGGGV